MTVIKAKHQIRAARAILAQIKGDPEQIAFVLGEADADHKDGGIYFLIQSLIATAAHFANELSATPDEALERSIEALLVRQDEETVAEMQRRNQRGGRP